jgi:hypothetical protein
LCGAGSVELPRSVVGRGSWLPEFVFARQADKTNMAAYIKTKMLFFIISF